MTRRHRPATHRGPGRSLPLGGFGSLGADEPGQQMYWPVIMLPCRPSSQPAHRLATLDGRRGGHGWSRPAANGRRCKSGTGRCRRSSESVAHCGAVRQPGRSMRRRADTAPGRLASPCPARVTRHSGPGAPAISRNHVHHVTLVFDGWLPDRSGVSPAPPPHAADPRPRAGSRRRAPPSAAPYRSPAR